MMAELPAGTVTFLFTDIEGSTELLKQLREKYKDLLADHRRILRAVFTKWGGQEVDTQGDAFFVSFPRASEAVMAAVEIQKALANLAWPEGVEVRVRMGLHTGEPWLAAEGYVGIDVHRAARIARICHGGQVLLSETTAALVRNDLPEGASLRQMGSFRLKDIQAPEPINQLVIAGLPSEFEPLKSRQVKAPETTASPSPASLPAFLTADEIGRPFEIPVFVSREAELEKLDGFLKQALAGRGQLAFITGGAGRGKTALMEAFSNRAQAHHPDLIVIAGNCNPYTGSGDPFLPFRDVMGMLTGDIESRWAAGTMATDHARRLWKVLPSAVETLVTHAPDLVDVFVPARDLVSRANLVAAPNGEWLSHLDQLATRSRISRYDLDQVNLFAQYLVLLRNLSDQFPLLLLLDDLQWADQGSIDLLFHLGRRLDGDRILVVGAYRPEEVALGRDGERHPLEKVLNELKRQSGEIWIDLREADKKYGQEFTEALLDSESNRLSPAFKKELFFHTEGHPLFVVELLRYLKARGDLVQDDQGHWVEEDDLDWSVLPVRVEGVIAERIARLSDPLREILEIASIEGATFTVQVISAIKDIDEHDLLRMMSKQLSRRHQLVRERGDLQVGKRRLSRYQFSHILFQRYLYQRLSPGERRILNARVGEELERLFAGSVEEIAVSLAHHFSESGDWAKTVDYLVIAGDRSLKQFAYLEAIQHYKRALALMEQTDDGQSADRKDGRHIRRRAQIYSQLGQAYRGLGMVPDCRDNLWQAIALLGSPIPDTRWKFTLHLVRQLAGQLFHFLFPKSIITWYAGAVRRDVLLQMARTYSALADIYFFANNTLAAAYVILRSMNLAERAGESAELAEACGSTGVAAGLVGLHRLARSYLKRAVQLAERVGEPATLVRVSILTSVYNLGIGDWDEVKKSLENAAEISGQLGDYRQRGECIVNLANAALLEGKTERSIGLFRQLLDETQLRRNPLFRVWALEGLAQHQLRKGQAAEALDLLKEASGLLAENADRISYIEVHGLLAASQLRLGEFSAAQSSANAAFQQLAGSSLMSYSLFQALVGIAEVYLELWNNPQAPLKGLIGGGEFAQHSGEICKYLRSYARLFPIGQPYAWLYQGKYDWRNGNRRKAFKAWQKSLAAAVKLGMPYEQGLAQCEIGLHLTSDDPVRRAHLSEAIRFFELVEADYGLSQARSALTDQVAA